MVKYAAIASLVLAVAITQASAAAITQASSAVITQASSASTSQASPPSEGASSITNVTCSGKIIQPEDVYDAWLGIPYFETCNTTRHPSGSAVMAGGWTVETTLSEELSDKSIEKCMKAFTKVVLACIMGGDDTRKSPGLNQGEYTARDGTLYKIQRTRKDE